MNWKDEIPKDLGSVPGAFSGFLDRINVCLRAVRALANLKCIGGLTGTISDGNIVLDATRLQDRLSSAESQLVRFPFQVSFVEGSGTTTPKAIIQASSRLYKSISTTDTQSITSLTSEITLASNTYIWIQITVSALAATAASIQTGTAWPALVTTSGSPAAQTQLCVPIGRVVATAPAKPGFEFTLSGTAYHFEQCLIGHLLIESRCNGGTPIIYAFPWGGAA